MLEEAAALHKYVVFAHHRDVQAELREAFGERAVGVDGDTAPEARADAVRRFQEEEEVRLFVGSIHAAGVANPITL